MSWENRVGVVVKELAKSSWSSREGVGENRVGVVVKIVRSWQNEFEVVVKELAKSSWSNRKGRKQK
jgi:hypothetical protein